MQGHGDQYVEDLLARTVAQEPRDVLALAAALREELGASLGTREGLVHVFVHRMVRDGRLRVGGRAPSGLTLYHPPGDEAVVGSAAEVAAAAPDGPGAKEARVLSRAVGDPAARLRVASDVRAHVAALEAEGRADDFGRPKALRIFLRRVDRGKRTILLPSGGRDMLLRFALHEGPWILGAVVVFLVLKFFVVSPYKIPSASMEPTLVEGDRVVVFTIAHQDVPDRYDVVVYEREGTNYVKRLIGLPGEEVALWHGDVYIDGALLVRPDWLVEALRSHVGTWQFGGEAPAGFATMREGGMDHWWWRSGRFEAHPNPGIHFGMHDGFAVLTGERRAGETLELILAHGPGGERAASRGWVLRLSDDGAQLARREGMDLTAGRAGEIETSIGGSSGAPLAAPVGDVRLELSYVDGILRARCGPFHYEGAQESPDGDLSVGVGRSVGAEGALALVLDRDHHYGSPRGATHGTPVAGQRRAHRIPADRVFCMGDNTTNSRDSRFSTVGDIPLDAIVGPVSFRIWPPSRIGRVR